MLKNKILKDSCFRVFFQIFSIIVHLPVALFFSFLRKDKKIWLFAHSHGYTDNARVLFEFISINTDEIIPIWLSSNDEELSKIPSNMLAVSNTSCTSIRLISNAMCFFLSTGFADFPRVTPLFRVKYYQLWHGWPIKKIGLISKELFPFDSFLLNKLLFLLLTLNWKRLNAFFCHNKSMMNLISSSFSLSSNICVTTGSPRYNIDYPCEDRNAILYAPTWRKDKKILSKHVNDLLGDEFMLFTENIKSTIKIKYHPLDGDLFCFKREQQKHFVNNEPLEAICMANVIISDYSSLLVDAAIKNKNFFIFTGSYFAIDSINDLFVRDYDVYNTYSISELSVNIGNSFSPSWSFVKVIDSCDSILKFVSKDSGIGF